MTVQISGPIQNKKLQGNQEKGKLIVLQQRENQAMTLSAVISISILFVVVHSVVSFVALPLYF